MKFLILIGGLIIAAVILTNPPPPEIIEPIKAKPLAKPLETCECVPIADFEAWSANKKDH